MSTTKYKTKEDYNAPGITIPKGEVVEMRGFLSPTTKGSDGFEFRVFNSLMDWIKVYSCSKLCFDAWFEKVEEKEFTESEVREMLADMSEKEVAHRFGIGNGIRPAANSYWITSVINDFKNRKLKC